MPQELLELSSIAVLHRFQSQDWYAHLKQKLPLPSDGFDQVKTLRPGQALVCAKSMATGSSTDAQSATKEQTPQTQAAGDAVEADNSEAESKSAKLESKTTSTASGSGNDVFRSFLKLKIRRRLTQDRGVSMVNMVHQPQTSGGGGK